MHACVGRSVGQLVSAPLLPEEECPIQSSQTRYPLLYSLSFASSKVIEYFIFCSILCGPVKATTRDSALLCHGHKYSRENNVVRNVALWCMAYNSTSS
jgi:hypothetical protein